MRSVSSHHINREKELKRLLAKTCAGAVLVVVTSPALAQWINGVNETGFYAGAGVGATRLKLDTTGLIGSADEEDTGWKLFAGYQFNKYIGLEGGYYDLGKASFAGTLATAIPPFPAGTAASVNLKSKAYALSAVGTLPLGRSAFSLTARLGIAYSEADADVRLGAGATASSSDDATELTYGLGVRYDVTRSFSVRGEWERFRIGGSNIGDKSDVDLFTLNAYYRF